MKNHIKEILAENKMNMGEGPRDQRELARKINRDESYISQIVTGEINVGVSLATTIARALGRPVEEVFYEDEKVAS